MSRDHKPARKNPPETKKARGGTLLGIVIGLIVGIGAALAVVWYMNNTPAPFVQNKTGTPLESSTRSPAAPAAATNGNASAKQTPATTPAPLPGKPGDPPVEKRFQFYDILPGKSEPKPDGKPPAAEPGKGPAAVSPPTVLAADAAKSGLPAMTDIQLQAGSFQNAKDADNLRANLALSGMEALVQQVMVGDKVWYRVRLGPYVKPEDMAKVRAELSKIGIEATVVKSKD
jgi:cell division protein FtsN